MIIAHVRVVHRERAGGAQYTVLRNVTRGVAGDSGGIIRSIERDRQRLAIGERAVGGRDREADRRSGLESLDRVTLRNERVSPRDAVEIERTVGGILRPVVAGMACI